MRGRPRRRSLVTKVLRPPIKEDGKKDHLVCYLWGGKIRPDHCPHGIGGTLGNWDNARDSVLCKRILEQTDFSLYSPDSPYCSSWETDKDGHIIPTDFVKRFYDFAKKHRYKWIHLLGYSGGGAVLSSALAYHSDNKDANMVKSLIIINGQIAELTGTYSCKPYTDAAYHAERIKASTLLIYGDDDPCRNDVDEWNKRNKSKVPPFYHGGHNFGQEGQESFEQVAKTIIDWLKNSPDQGVRPLRLRRRRRRRHARRRARAVRRT